MEAQSPQGELRDALSGGGEGSERGKSTFGGSAPLIANGCYFSFC